MIITDLFDIDFHIFTVIKFLFNLGVRFNYIIYTYMINLLPLRLIFIHELMRETQIKRDSVIIYIY